MEDIGYYCVDNIPPILISKFVELCYNAQENITKVAIVTDVREGILFEQLEGVLHELDNQGYLYKILFLDANNDVLINRYKQSRRKHPLVDKTGLNKAILRERMLLQNIKNKADYVICTTEKDDIQLKNEIYGIFREDRHENSMIISISSFGFKYGLPPEADLVFDVRFLPNPFYIANFKHRTGLEKCVIDYIMQLEDAQMFTKKLIDLSNFLIPRYISEGKLQLFIAVGCTGGRHRSVVMAENLYRHLLINNQNTLIYHRDIIRQLP